MPKDPLGRSGSKKQLSCEFCRRRKIRCERPGDEERRRMLLSAGTSGREGGRKIGGVDREDGSDHGGEGGNGNGIEAVEREGEELDDNGAGPSSPRQTIKDIKPSAENPLPPCTPCAVLGVECVTLYNRKRRGPPSSHVKRSSDISPTSLPVLARRDAPNHNHHHQHQTYSANVNPILPEPTIHVTPPQTRLTYPGESAVRLEVNTSSYSNPNAHSNTGTGRHTNHTPNTNNPYQPSSLSPLHSFPLGTSTSSVYSQPISNPGENYSLSPFASQSANPMAHNTASMSTIPAANESIMKQSTFPEPGFQSSTIAMPPSSASAAVNRPDLPHFQSSGISAGTGTGTNPYNPPHWVELGAPRLIIEDTLPRDTAVYIVSLFFDYVHSLIPWPHRPTFLERMKRRDDQHDPLFFALIMSVLAASIVQIPKALIPMNDEPPIELASRCMRVSRAVSIHLYDPPTLEMVTIRYFDAVFCSLTGKKGAWVSALGEVTRLVVQMEMHRESSYAGLGPLETEMRRRVFQTVFLADKSAACMQDQLIMLRGEDCDTLYPRELDDEYITEGQYLEQPEGTTSKMAGHRVIAQIFTIIGEIICIRRGVSRIKDAHNPSGVLSHLRHLDSLAQRLVDIFSDLPSPLRLEIASSPVNFDMHSSAAQPWETQALSDLNIYLRSLINTDPAPPTSEAFLVMQGNVHVTRAIARLTLITCREEVMAHSGPAGSASRTAAERVLSYSYQSQDRRDLVISDLLYALKKIPVQALAVNSHSLVNKVRFVAVTLLDSVIPPMDMTETEHSDSRTNQDALISFLGILSTIEQNLVNDYSST